MKQANVAVENMIDRVSLQAADLNRLLALLVHDAGAFAEHFGGTNTPTAFTQDIRFQDDPGRAANVFRSSFSGASPLPSSRTPPRFFFFRSPIRSA